MRLKNKIIRLLVTGCILLLVSAGFLPARKEWPMEKISLRTDRDLYIAGEQVRFKLYTLDATTGKPVHYSDIVYLELLDRQHSPLVQKKFSITRCEASGSFTLPYDMASDHYYVRAYTAWMKNAGAAGYAYQLLTVINPYEKISPEMISPGPAGENESTWKQGHPDDLPERTGEMKIGVRTDLETYGARQKVVLEIDTRDMTGNPVNASLMLSVARMGLLKIDRQSLTDPEQTTAVSEITYPPEREGHVIQGQILYRSNGEPIAGDTMIYSVVGRKSIFDYTISDQLGNFTFLAEIQEGIRELVIQNLNPSKVDYQVMLKDPFSADFAGLQLPAFYIDTFHLSEINQTVIAAQIHALYAVDTPAGVRIAGDSLSGSLSFYGIPEQVVILADYVRLPEMREVFFELIPDAQMRGQGDQTIIRVRDTKYGPYFKSLPLMLIDGVVVPEPEQIAELDPHRVERIDVVTSKFQFGILQFPGIVSIFTQESRCPVTLPRHYFRQSYNFLSAD